MTPTPIQSRIKDQGLIVQISNVGDSIVINATIDNKIAKKKQLVSELNEYLLGHLAELITYS